MRKITLFALSIFLIVSSVYAEPFPKFDGWYCGDTHYHSDYTNVNGELGWSISKTNQEITKAGLDFFFVTDHSNSIKHWGGKSIWEDFKKECNRYPNCLIGNEINCDYNKKALESPKFRSNGNHLLGYDYSEYFDDGSDLFDPIFLKLQLPTRATLPCSEAITHVHYYGGFTYAAHPESDIDPLSDWFNLNLNYTILDKWHNYSLPFTGLQIWNEANQNWDGSPNTDLDKGLEKWKEILLEGRHVYISGGTDTHAIKCGIGKSEEDCRSIFAKVATCVNAGSFSKSNIIDAFKNGKSYVTNNGALVMKAWSYTDTDEWNPSTILVGIAENITVCKKLSFHIDFEYNVISRCILSIYEGDINSKNEKVIDSGRILTGKDEDGIIWNDFASNNVYYRAECVSLDGKSRIYTNPIWVNVDTNDRDNDDVCDTYDTIDNVAPENNMFITRNTIFDYGEYVLPDGVRIVGENIFVDCQNSSLIGIGNIPSVGITFGGDNITLKNCKVSNYHLGIDLAGVGNHLIEDGSIFDNNFGIVIDIESPDTIKIENNDVYNNAQRNIHNSFDAFIDAKNNWWGTTNKTKIEEKINHGLGLVEYEPYSNIPFGDSFEMSVLITAVLDPSTPEAIAGEQVIIISSLKNIGEIETTYAVSVTGTEGWSSLTAIEPTTVTLDRGESEDVKIYFDLNEDSEGEQFFTIKATYGDKTTEQEVILIVEEPTFYCGDGSCNGGETCSSCSTDCGTCPPTLYCGDGTCNNGETCSSCSRDCGCSSGYRCSNGVCKKKSSSSRRHSSSSSSESYIIRETNTKIKNSTLESTPRIIKLGAREDIIKLGSPEKKPGFFKKIINFFKGLFS